MLKKKKTGLWAKLDYSQFDAENRFRESMQKQLTRRQILKYR